MKKLDFIFVFLIVFMLGMLAVSACINFNVTGEFGKTWHLNDRWIRENEICHEQEGHEMHFNKETGMCEYTMIE